MDWILSQIRGDTEASPAAAEANNAVNQPGGINTGSTTPAVNAGGTAPADNAGGTAPAVNAGGGDPRHPLVNVVNRTIRDVIIQM